MTAAALILPDQGIVPKIDQSAFLAPTAAIIGDVEIGPEVGVWFGVTIRGDMNVIRIGRRVNIQDGTVVHVDSRKYGTFIGDNVTIGHGAIIHACVIEDACLVGMGAAVLDGVLVKSHGFVGAAHHLQITFRRLLRR